MKSLMHYIFLEIQNWQGMKDQIGFVMKRNMFQGRNGEERGMVIESVMYVFVK